VPKIRRHCNRIAVSAPALAQVGDSAAKGDARLGSPARQSPGFCTSHGACGKRIERQRTAAARHRLAEIDDAIFEPSTVSLPTTIENNILSFIEGDV